MNKLQNILTAATAIALLITGGPGQASDNKKLKYDSAVKSCTGEINDKADYSGATRVRHMVVLTKKYGGRYVFTIGTEIFTDSDEVAAREYASHCIAAGEDKLIRFKINDVSA